MDGILDTLCQATKGLHSERYQSHKFCYDSDHGSVVEYEKEREVQWKEWGETEHFRNMRNLRDKAKELADEPSWFHYFLDGSRHTYKVDDMSFRRNVYPILAGQVGVSCCKREERHILPEFFRRSLVLVVPDSALKSEFNKRTEVKSLCDKINHSPKLELLRKKLHCQELYFSDVLSYNLDSDMKYDKKGIAKIQDDMIAEEKRAVADLVPKLNKTTYLIKDGSLEYKAVHESSMNLSEAKMRLNYQFVLGVSKSFNPTKCYVKGGGTNSSIVANLKAFERTPAYRYSSAISGENVDFCIWYLRLRDNRYTKNVFDGVIKVEKLIQEDERKNGVETDLIDMLSVFLLRERTPVCYGRDKRWANHIYPIYATELFAKSHYMSDRLFLNLF